MTRKSHLTPRTSEHAEQVAVITWARLQTGRWPCLAWLHSVPNHNVLLAQMGKEQGARVTAYMKAEGLTKGISDLFLPWPAGKFHGCYIEMKLLSNRPTFEQAQFMSFAQTAGYYVNLCHSAEDAIATLAFYLNLGPFKAA